MENIFLNRITISKLFDKKNINWDLNNEVSILVGNNGTGKSTIINILYALIQQKSSVDLSACASGTLEFKDGSLIQCEHELLDINFDALNNLVKRANGHKLIRQNKELKNKLSMIDDFLKEIEQDDQLTELLSKIENTQENSGGSDDEIYKTRIGQIRITSPGNLKPINVERISTINMNANSIQQLKKSDGENITLLDFEIQSEILHFLKNSKNKAYEQFILEVNSFFKETDKKITVKSKSLYINDVSKNERIALNQLSSGEKQVLYILLKATNSATKDTIFLMDEPEISLHLEWQKKLINSIKNIHKRCQLIVVTHSPTIIMNGFLGNSKRIEDISERV